ncbi:hypothetical protein MRB53_023036 [Persea americana]|uniref:Uncharacterized protein n=1 Tax=Persea americana TaxID=3435 RepID=A0ACC2L9J2_PERAE|nr:hypothetical protein MRB53_023036 [Persea americana]
MPAKISELYSNQGQTNAAARLKILVTVVGVPIYRNRDSTTEHSLTTKQKQKNKLSIRFRSHPSDAAEDEVTVFGCDPKERKSISERRSKNKNFTLYSEGATIEVISNRGTTRATNGI